MEWIANMDLSGYQNQSGLTAIINRLEVIRMVILRNKKWHAYLHGMMPMHPRRNLGEF